MDELEIGGAVDVVIPMRNGAATIRRTLATVHAQTLQPRRIIIVDDGSNDGGPELVRGLPLVELIKTPPLGVSQARNAGIRASRAEFIAFLDADDLWRSDKLQRQMEVARRRPEAAVITCDQVTVDETGTRACGPRSRARYAGHAGARVLSDFGRLRGWSSIMLVRRSALLASGGYDERLSFSEDIDICLRLAHSYAIAFSPQLMTFIVQNPGSVTRRPRPPGQVMEATLQGAGVMEKWIGRANDPSALARQAAEAILKSFVRVSFDPRALYLFRREMTVRTPCLARHIGRNDIQFFFNLGTVAVAALGPYVGRRLARAFAASARAVSSRSAVLPALRA